MSALSPRARDALGVEEPVEGTVVYADAGWLDGDGEVAAGLVLDPAGLRFGAGPPVAVPDGTVPDALAAAAIEEVAREAAAHAPGDGAVTVTGKGLLADRVRAALGPRDAGEDAPFRCVIDTTGDPDTITAALGELEPLGTLVAAGPLGHRSFALNLYTDLHARGVRMVGVAPPLASGILPTPGDAQPPSPSGSPRDGGPWHRIRL